VNAAEQDSFCSGTTCTITEIYDQSPEGNNLAVEGQAGENGGADKPAVANALPVTVDGHEAYGLDITQGTGYRDDNTKGIAVNGEPESMYMVASGSNVNSGCCFDFGNAETNNDDNGAGHMDAVNLTAYCEFSPCSGPGPWVEADMENGQYVSGDGSNPNDTSNDNEGVMTSGFASASTDAAVQASIVSAGYAGSASPSAPSAAGPTVVHAGYSSVYTVDASNGDLQETYLPAIGDPWSTQDLSANYGTPAMAG
jgi:hypothetical protein